MKKYLAMTLAVLMLVAAFAGCSKKEEETKAYGWFNTCFTSATPTANALIDTGNSSTFDSLCQLSLYRDKLNETADGWEYDLNLAASWPKQVDADGYVWEVTIRKDAKWQNGDKITVDDIEFTYQMYADPKQANVDAVQLTKQKYGVIKNIAEYNLGEVASWDDVGFKKIDDYTFQVEFTEPRLQSQVHRALTCSLVHKDTYLKSMSADGTATLWGSDAENYMSCGAFILTEWENDVKAVFTRNPDYIYADEIKIEGMIYTFNTDANARLQLFLEGKLDTCALDYTYWESYEDDPRVYEYYNDSLMYFMINVGNPAQGAILGDINFRKALFWGMDRVALADTLGVYPATRLVRRAVMGNPLTGVPFYTIPQDYVVDPYNAFDKEKANQYLDQAYEKAGQTKTTMRILISETATHIKGAAEILQKQYGENFGGKLEIKVDQKPSSVVYAERRWNPEAPEAYDSALGSLLPSATDPRDTFNFYRSDYTPPRFAWNDPDFDKLFADSMKLDLENENDAIIEACQQMEKILLDELVNVPIYERPNKVLYSTRIHLPVEEYVIGYGFGEKYMTISEEK